MAQSLRPFNSMMTISILAVASEDLPATCKLGQFLHYLGDLYLSVERRGKICKHVHGGPPLHFAPPIPPPPPPHIYAHNHHVRDCELVRETAGF